MKAFLEEYGLVIVIVIVVAMLILVAAVVSNNGEGRLFQTFNAFTKKGQTAVSEGLTMTETELKANEKVPGYYDPSSGLGTDGVNKLITTGGTGGSGGSGDGK